MLHRIAHLSRIAPYAFVAATAAVVLALSTPASAQIVSADFNETLNLPDFNAGLPKIVERNNVALPSAGPQLTAANVISNPSGWNDLLNVSFDPVTNILSVTGDGSNQYQTLTVTLDNLTFATPGQQITGITPSSFGGAVTAEVGTLNLSTFFGPNSFGFTYSVPLGQGNTFRIEEATDTFQVSLSSVVVVPEANTLALVLPALGMVGAVIVTRRKK